MKKRRGFVLLLCTAVLAVSLSVSVSAAFSDIPETAWYAPAVEYVQENGIMNGEGEDLSLIHIFSLPGVCPVPSSRRKGGS